MIDSMKLLPTEPVTLETRPPSSSGRYKRYPPSILLIAQRTSQALQIKQDLETRGCQVCWIGASSEDLGRASQKYFDFIVLDMDPSAEQDLAICPKLQHYPELADIPTAILTTGDASGRSAEEFKKGSVYFLSKAPCTGQRLWQIIEQVYYLTYRYLTLARS